MKLYIRTTIVGSFVFKNLFRLNENKIITVEEFQVFRSNFKNDNFN